MQLLPLLTPTHFITNNKKRSRSITDDFGSHYLKKRLIATIPDFDTKEYSKDPIEECKPIESMNVISDEEDMPINSSEYSRIHVLELNGTVLPMEQKPGQSKYSIPDFVLKPQGQLILYQNNPLLIPSVSTLIEKQDQEESYEPMELD